MQDVKQESLDIYYETDAAVSYFIIRLTASDEIKNYQVEMITNNPIPNILPFHLKQKNDSVELCYNITSKLTLRQFLKRKKLKKSELISILQSISQTLLNCKNHFLWDNNFIISADYIYINPHTLAISMVYMPILRDNDIRSEFKDFVINLVFELAQIDDAAGDGFMLRILNELKSEVFHIGGFSRLLSEIRENALQQPAITETSRTIYNNPTELKSKPLKEAFSSKEPVQPADKAKLLFMSNREIAALLLQLLLGVILLAFRLNMQPYDAITFVGFVILLLGIDFWLLSKLLDKKQVANLCRLFSIKSMSDKIHEKLAVNKKKSDEYSRENVCIYEAQGSSGRNNNETVLLGKQGHVRPHLKRIENGAVESICIIKDSFIIGRLNEQVDYLSRNSAVGKVHAEIICKDGEHFVKDLNSKNGTYINGNRIKSNIETKIQNQDKVAFADSEYLFVIE